jgi:hypothetical protein
MLRTSRFRVAKRGHNSALRIESHKPLGRRGDLSRPPLLGTTAPTWEGKSKNRLLRATGSNKPTREASISTQRKTPFSAHQWGTFRQASLSIKNTTGLHRFEGTRQAWTKIIQQMVRLQGCFDEPNQPSLYAGQSPKGLLPDCSTLPSRSAAAANS